MTEVTATDNAVTIDSPLGKIKGIPIPALGWIVLALAFGFLLVKMTGSFERSLVKMETELSSIATEETKQTILLEKILDKD